MNQDAVQRPSVDPTPEKIWEAVNAFQQTAAIRAAVDLELFTAIGEGRDSAAALAARCSASERGIRILADYLTVMGFLTKDDGRYRLTKDTQVFLDRRSPAYMGGILTFMHAPELLSAFNDLTTVVRKGTTILEGAGVVDPEDPVWVEFARSMVPLVAPSAAFIAEVALEGAPGPLRVLDIAAGHGLFGIAIARRAPQAEIVALDWPKVLEVAHANATAAGVQQRYRVLPGDAFKVDFGSGFDVVLVTNLYHHFDLAMCAALARKVHAALTPGGRMITLEFVPNEDRVSPPIPATFALIMLAGTPAGDAYPKSAYDRIFTAAGFARNELRPVPKSPHQLIVSYK